MTKYISVKAIVLALALIVSLSAVLNGTVAYLWDETETENLSFNFVFDNSNS